MIQSSGAGKSILCARGSLSLNRKLPAISNALAIACTGHLLMEKDKLKYTIEKSRQIDSEIEKR